MPPPWALWFASLLLLLARALIAAAESALYGTSELRAKELSAVRPRAGARVLRQKRDPEATAAAIRSGMVVCGFAAAAIATLAPPYLLNVTGYRESPWLFLLSGVAGALGAALVASVIDVAARGMAARDPENWALRLSGLVAILVVVFYPLMRLILRVLNLVATPLGGPLRFESPPPPLEELEKLLAAQAARNEIDKGAPQLIRSIFEFSDKKARDVMVSRTNVLSLELATSPSELLRLLAEEGHSRVPVYKEDFDQIVGILHSRDLIPLLQHPELIVLADIIRPAHFVPWVKPIGDLLREMQKGRIHMAIVVDEYGGFMGIVTLEDILEEIVGEIGDEFDVEERPIERQPDGSFLVNASLSVNEFAGSFGLSLPEGDYETLSGFVSSLAGAIPEVGEGFQFNGWHFAVHSKDGARIERVRVSKPKSMIAPAKEKEAAAPPRS